MQGPKFWWKINNLINYGGNLSSKLNAIRLLALVYENDVKKLYGKVLLDYIKTLGYTSKIRMYFLY